MIQSEMKQALKAQDKNTVGLWPILFVVGILFVLFDLVLLALAWLVCQLF